MGYYKARGGILDASTAGRGDSVDGSPAGVDRKIIPVIFACDENYAPYLPVVIQSLVDNASTACPYEIIILDCCVDTHSRIFDEIKEDLQEILAAKSNFSLKIIRIYNALKQNAFLHKNEQALKRYGYGTYARILIPDLFADYEKLLYLDIDHIVLGDIAFFFDFPIGDNLIAAVPDINAAYARLAANSKRKLLVEKKLGLGPDNYYIIASPMLFNISACRDFGFTEKVLAVLSRDYGLPFPDQDAINSVCKGRIFYLPQKWGRTNARNFTGLCHIIRKMGQPGQIETVLGNWRADSDDIALIHYVAAPKPWAGVEPDYSDLWWRYAAKTKKSTNLLFSLLFPFAAGGSRGNYVRICKIFGIPFLTITAFPHEKHYSFIKIPFARKIYGKENCYIYIFGLKVFTIRKNGLKKLNKIN